MKTIQNYIICFLFLSMILLGGNMLTAQSHSVLLLSEGENYKRHTVKEGETLSTIGKKYKVSPKELMELNELADDQIEIGQTLKIKSVDHLSQTGGGQSDIFNQDCKDCEPKLKHWRGNSANQGTKEHVR